MFSPCSEKEELLTKIYLHSQVRKSPTTGDGSPDGISASTGIFVCAIKGAYKFDFQGEKVYTK